VFYTTTIQKPGHLGATHASLDGTLLGAVFVVPVLVTLVAALLGEFGRLFVVARRGWRSAERIGKVARVPRPSPATAGSGESGAVHRQ
jgi:hypothetical protein